VEPITTRKTVINVSPTRIFLKDEVWDIGRFHRPYFLALYDPAEDSFHQEFRKDYEENTKDFVRKIADIGDIGEYKSFLDPSVKRLAYPVYTVESHYVPQVSDKLFFNYGIGTAEHDIPYLHRAASDLAADNDLWIFDTHGKRERLKVLAYDIEIPRFRPGAAQRSFPVEIIGHSTFDLEFSSSKDLDREDFDIEIHDAPSDWDEREVVQLSLKNPNDMASEIENIMEFCREVMRADVIAGHNIIGFDNLQIANRIGHFLDDRNKILSRNDADFFQEFMRAHMRKDTIFTFGRRETGYNFYPVTLDTYYAARRFFFFLNSFSLKELAPFMGIKVPGRVYMDPNQIAKAGIKDLLVYNEHDVKEQLGITMQLVQQALPLAFTTGMPFEILLPAGSTKIWDYMAMIRARRHRKIMPPTCRATGVASKIIRHVPPAREAVPVEKRRPGELFRKEDIVRFAMSLSGHPDYNLSDFKEFIRVAKYRDEMPRWVEHPYVVAAHRRGPMGSKDTSDRVESDEDMSRHGYALPGGMTISPEEVDSDFIPWWNVVVADVGAMYPTILKGKNLSSNVVRLARKDEEPDDGLWLFNVAPEMRGPEDFHFRTWREMAGGEFGGLFDRGYFFGVKIAGEPGMVNLAMTAVMKMIFKVKRELQQAVAGNRDAGNLKMMYDSLKGLRNAGTHGILVASRVSCRQFNLWAGAEITTTGQKILYDTQRELERAGMRVVYGDTDGIYVGCGNSAFNLPDVVKAISEAVDVPPGAGADQSARSPAPWLSDPDETLRIIEKCNRRWRSRLNYPDFELEPERADAMLFVKHKNYLIWNVRDGKLKLTSKGNNFKGSDKANIARKALEQIMLKVLAENLVWTNEKDARIQIRTSIKHHTREFVANMDLTDVDVADLTMIQSVSPPGYYKPNADGSLSKNARRARALGQVLGEPIRAPAKLKFVVVKRPLPGFEDSKGKPGVKPIEYMWPLDKLKSRDSIDLEWYREMIRNYIRGAFGLSDMEASTQRSIADFM